MLPASHNLSLGRFRRGQDVPFTIAFAVAPDLAPLVRIYRAGTLVDQFRLPRIDRPNQVFALDWFLDDLYTDSLYSFSISWAFATVADYVLGDFDVRGGTGLPPVTSMIELRRPLGRSVVSFDERGDARIGYNAGIS